MITLSTAFFILFNSDPLSANHVEVRCRHDFSRIFAIRILIRFAFYSIRIIFARKLFAQYFRFSIDLFIFRHMYMFVIVG